LIFTQKKPLYMKKILKEGLWLVFTILVSFPLSFLFLHLLNQIQSNNLEGRLEQIFIFELFLFGFIVNFVGIYLTRFIVTTFKLLSN